MRWLKFIQIEAQKLLCQVWKTITVWIVLRFFLTSIIQMTSFKNVNPVNIKPILQDRKNRPFGESLDVTSRPVQ